MDGKDEKAAADRRAEIYESWEDACCYDYSFAEYQCYPPAHAVASSIKAREKNGDRF